MVMKIRYFTLTVLGIRFKEAELHLSVLMQNEGSATLYMEDNWVFTTQEIAAESLRE